MTVDEVHAVTTGAASTLPQDQSSERAREATLRLKSPLTWKGQTFIVFYGFDTAGKLSSVTLQLVDRSEEGAQNLLKTLTQLYGSPSTHMDQPDTGVAMWDRSTKSVGYMRIRDPQTAVGAPNTSVNFQPSQ
jgi:hypothetical protein